jgi:hypothetical protein
LKNKLPTFSQFIKENKNVKEGLYDSVLTNMKAPTEEFASLIMRSIINIYEEQYKIKTVEKENLRLERNKHAYSYVGILSQKSTKKLIDESSKGDKVKEFLDKIEKKKAALYSEVIYHKNENVYEVFINVVDPDEASEAVNSSKLNKNIKTMKTLYTNTAAKVERELDVDKIKIEVPKKVKKIVKDIKKVLGVN